MNPLEQPISDPQPAPEVMRPAQAIEQTVFFDRKQDAALLREKVFSSRFTVLYGPAGVGKLLQVVEDPAQELGVVELEQGPALGPGREHRAAPLDPVEVDPQVLDRSLHRLTPRCSTGRSLAPERRPPP